MKPFNFEPFSNIDKPTSPKPSNSEYFLQSFYQKRTDSLLRPKYYSNLSSFTNSNNKKSSIEKKTLQKFSTKNSLQFFSKKNRLINFFNDPSSLSVLNSNKMAHHKIIDESNIVFMNKKVNKAQVNKPKPARLSLDNGLVKHSEAFQLLVNKFHNNLKTSKELPTAYLNKEIRRFIGKSKFSKENNDEFSETLNENTLKSKTLANKKIEPHHFQSIQLKPIVSSSNCGLNSNENKEKKFSYNFESIDITTLDIKPLNISNLTKKTPTQKENVLMMIKKKKDENSQLIKKSENDELTPTAKNHKDLKIQISPNENLSKKSEIEKIFEHSPLLSNQKRVLELKPSLKKNYKQIRKALKKALQYMAELKLTISEIMHNQVFSKKPYQKEGSYDFIKATKNGNLNMMKKLLDFNKYLIFDFDDVFMTPLHWAARRGNIEAVIMLLKRGSDINAKDIVGRTPLFIGIQCNRIDIIKLLLYYKANPWSSLEVDYNKVLKPQTLAKELVTKARKLHILISMTPIHHRSSLWQRESWLLFLEGGHDDLFKKLNEKPILETSESTIY